MQLRAAAEVWVRLRVVVALSERLHAVVVLLVQLHALVVLSAQLRVWAELLECSPVAALWYAVLPYVMLSFAA
jgi:hypothetical protein